ncbi:MULTISPECIES: alpha/beta family hydrolase [unclassified Pseudonocardia]|uniref:alpha/beta hydrolase family protein n=1 Tax=unclassified Pseudonocardia TaxID=2619320 RepID=UPI00094AC59F|nr:alpha/beta family hydrolase [Pseudonocardia sp. Ae707_Ps1]OLM20504.1 Esterase/lipase/thioesterase family active site [Pseudonocardia sp. Ae707_Ps1]
MTGEETATGIDTPRGPARVTWHPSTSGPARALLLLGHGAGGGIGAPDLVAATAAATAAGCDVGLVEQPYRVAGRRAPAPAGHLDEAWLAVAAAVRKDGDLPLLQGGRSSGARVACRTAAATGAAGVLCLAFPLHPPGRPERTRLPELDGAGVPVLVVQGRSDRFGVPDPGPDRRVVLLDGDHGLKKQHAELRSAVGEWLTGFTRPGDARPRS